MFGWLKCKLGWHKYDVQETFHHEKIITIFLVECQRKGCEKMDLQWVYWKKMVTE